MVVLILPFGLVEGCALFGLFSVVFCVYGYLMEILCFGVKFTYRRVFLLWWFRGRLQATMPRFCCLADD